MRKNNFLNKFKKTVWILTPFILLTVIIILLLDHCDPPCLDCDELQNKIDQIEQKIKDKDCLDCHYDTLHIPDNEVDSL